MPTLSKEIIIAAISGFEAQRSKIDAQIAELRAMLPGGRSETPALPDAPGGTRRRISAAARKRMKEGQQRRWAKIRGESGPTSSPTPAPTKPKRTRSAAGKTAIVPALKKRGAVKKKADGGKPASKTVAPKKKISPARKAALVANLAKARAARAAKKTAGE